MKKKKQYNPAFPIANITLLFGMILLFIFYMWDMKIHMGIIAVLTIITYIVIINTTWVKTK